MSNHVHQLFHQNTFTQPFGHNYMSSRSPEAQPEWDWTGHPGERADERADGNGYQYNVGSTALLQRRKLSPRKLTPESWNQERTPRDQQCAHRRLCGELLCLCQNLIQLIMRLQEMVEGLCKSWQTVITELWYDIPNAQ